MYLKHIPINIIIFFIYSAYKVRSRKADTILVKLNFNLFEIGIGGIIGKIPPNNALQK